MQRKAALLKTEYRPDIDGLRGLAILSVVIYHFFSDYLPSGFIGVDIFFVISGYLITKIIIKDLQNSQFSFKHFYLKRCNRLLPALNLVLISVLIFAPFVLFADEFQTLCKHALGGVSYLSNYILYSESGYFDQNMNTKPLLHLWSLAIEEQFYLIWPLIIFICHHLKFKKIIPILIIFTISFLLNVLTIHINHSITFYSLPTRLWELSAGGILATLEKDKIKCFSFFKKIDFSLVGFFLISLGYFLIEETSSFPGYWALLPCFGAVFIIGQGSSGIINRILSLRALIYIGLISYPLYLWHWPIFSFYSITIIGTQSIQLKLLLILLSFTFAIMTYEIFEKNIQIYKNSVAVNFTLLFCLLLIGGISLFIIITGNYPKHNLDKMVSTQKAYTGEPGDHQNQCVRKFSSVDFCSINNLKSEPTAIIIGDSNAQHFFPGLQKVFSKKNENLLLLGSSGTLPFYKIHTTTQHQNNFNIELENIFKNKSIKTVILSAIWESYYSDQGALHEKDFHYTNNIIDPNIQSPTNKQQLFEIGLERTIKMLIKYRKTIYLIHTIPLLPFQLSDCLPRPINPLTSKLKQLWGDRNCMMPSRKEVFRQSTYRVVFKKMKEKFGMINILDPTDILCNQENCLLNHEQNFLYSDSLHLSTLGSIYLSGQLSL